MALEWQQWGQRLKEMRVERKWSQRELAAKIRTSRNTVNRWEIGDRHPSMTMLERIARAFGIDIATVLPRPRRSPPTPPAVTAPATRAKFELRMLFPRGEPFSEPLPRLMMAADDARHLQRLMIMARERVADANEIEQAILNGELNHLFRLMCGHLWEAAEPFNHLDRKCAQLLDVAMTDGRAKEALARVRVAYSPRQSGKGKRAFIDVVRNFVGFHYNERKLAKALEKHDRAGHLEGNLILSPFSGLGRYTVTDQLTTLLMADEIGGTFEEFSRQFMANVGEAIRLAGDLGDVVDYLMTHLLAPHGDKIERRDGVIRVDPLIVRAKEEVEKERRARG